MWQHIHILFCLFFLLPCSPPYWCSFHTTINSLQRTSRKRSRSLLQQIADCHFSHFVIFWMHNKWIMYLSCVMGLLSLTASTWYYFFRSLDSGVQTFSNSLFQNLSKEQQKMKDCLGFFQQLLSIIFLVLFYSFLYKSILSFLCLSSALIPLHAFFHPIIISVIPPSLLLFLPTPIFFLSSPAQFISVFSPLFPPLLCQHSPLTHPDRMQAHTHSSPHQPTVTFTC